MRNMLARAARQAAAEGWRQRRCLAAGSTASVFIFSRSFAQPAQAHRDVEFPSSASLDGKDLRSPGSVFAKPKSLGLDEHSSLRAVDPPPEGLSGLALKLLGFYSRESQLTRGARTLYSRISAQADRPELYASFVLEKTFRTTHAILLLHVWLTIGRLRSEGKDGAKVAQLMYELHNHDLEKRIVVAGVKMLISKWMKELEKNFYGAVAAYDAAMEPTASKDDLARALWRNVFAENDALMPSGVEMAPVKSLARYVRSQAACLAVTDSESLLTGNIEFSHTFAVAPLKENASPVERETVPV